MKDINLADTEDKYFERLRFEHELIHRRVTWLLTSQTILFAAFGFVLKTDKTTQDVTDFLQAMATAGAVIASLILVGIAAGIVAKYSVWKDYQVRVPKAEWGVRTWIAAVALVPDIGLSLAFIAAWVWGYKHYSHESFPLWYCSPAVLGLLFLAVRVIGESRSRRTKK